MRCKVGDLVVGQIFRFIDTTVDYVVLDDSLSTHIYARCLYNNKRRTVYKYLTVDVYPYTEIQTSLF